jgi:hypothetical protein
MIYIQREFRKDWFRNSKVDGEHRHTDNKVIKACYLFIYFFKIMKVGLKCPPYFDETDFRTEN